MMRRKLAEIWLSLIEGIMKLHCFLILATRSKKMSSKSSFRRLVRKSGVTTCKVAKLAFCSKMFSQLFRRV